jgi:hypothetical protein
MKLKLFRLQEIFLFLILVFPTFAQSSGSFENFYSDIPVTSSEPHQIADHLFQNVDGISAKEYRQSYGCQIQSPPRSLGLDPFYRKVCFIGRLPIISSAQVSDKDLQNAWFILAQMLSDRPDLIDAIASSKTKYGIIGATEQVTDLPEYRNLNQMWPEVDWNKRTRGLGATSTIPLSSSAEENILCHSNDRYIGESITVHEFAHTVHGMGLNFIDPEFSNRLNAVYQEAMESGLWQNTYAATNKSEYWAEGVQSYFNTNREANPPNGVHNHVNTRDELRYYDPKLFHLIKEVFRNAEVRGLCH